MKTSMFTSDKINREWYLVDAEDKVLGRLTSQMAKILQGKHKPTYTPHSDCGDFIIVINAEKIKVTGNKELDKTYDYYTGYMGGLRELTLEQMRRRKPEEIIRLAVKRMLPKNKLGRKMLKKLKIYRGTDHPHEAQQPKAYNPLKEKSPKKRKRVR